MKLEKDLETAVIEHCKFRGLLTYKFVSPAHRGVPDRIICGRGKTMFIELKRRGQKPTPLQERELKRLADVGVYADWSDRLVDSIQKIDGHFFEENYI